jgi:hypothetical protein
VVPRGAQSNSARTTTTDCVPRSHRAKPNQRTMPHNTVLWSAFVLLLCLMCATAKMVIT